MGKRNPSKARKENRFDQTALDQSDSCSSQETGSNWVSTSIKSIYNKHKKGMVIAGIAVLPILYIYAIYAEGSGTTVTNVISLIYPLLNEGIGLPILTGTLNRDEVDGTRALALIRVSTTSQGDNSSQSTQREALEETAEKDGLEIVGVLEAEESGAKIEREQLNEVLERAKNDEFDVLMVYELDRLSRADPWDTQAYLRDLRDAGVTLYSDSYGYFDWTSHYDFDILGREASFARRWLERLEEGATQGYLQKLKQRKWPFGDDTPAGYATDEDRKLHLDDDYGQYIPEFFEVYAETENRAETKRQLNETLKQNGLDPISYSQVKTLLQSQLCIGKLSYDGEVAMECSDLKMVDKELFHEVQSILSGRETRASAPDVPEFIGEAAQEYGIDFVMNLFESFKPFRCRECDGDLEKKGTKEVWGVEFPKYECKSCEYQGPLVTEEELKKLHQTLPLRCPFCCATEEFETTRLRELGTKFDYRYACQNCGQSFGSDLSPDRIIRRLNYPNLGFEIDG